MNGALRVKNNVKDLLNWKPLHNKVLERIINVLVDDEEYNHEFTLKRESKSDGSCVNSDLLPDYIPQHLPNKLNFIDGIAHVETTLSYTSSVGGRVSFTFVEYFKSLEKQYRLTIGFSRGSTKVETHFNCIVLEDEPNIEMYLTGLDYAIHDFSEYVLSAGKDEQLDLNHDTYRELIRSLNDEFHLRYCYCIAMSVTENKESRYVNQVPGSVLAMVPDSKIYRDAKVMSRYTNVVVDALEETTNKRGLNRMYYYQNVDLEADTAEFVNTNEVEDKSYVLRFREGIYSLRFHTRGNHRDPIETLNDMSDEEIRQYVLDYFNH